MKRVLMIFIIIVGGYLLFQTVTNSSSKDNARVDVTEKVEEISFNIASLHLFIIPQDRDDLETKYEGRGKVTVEKSGDTIKVEQKRQWFPWFSFLEKSELYVYVPENYDNDMTIDLSSGSVDLSGKSKNEPFILNDLIIDLSSGNIQFENVKVDKFHHDGSSGNLKIDSFAANSSNIDISSGNVKMRDYVGKLEADLSSGRLEVQMAELVDSIRVDVSSGSVELDLPDDANFTFNGEVGSGNISNDFPLKMTEKDGRDIRGTHGSGEHDFTIDVSSGSVKIY